MSDEQLKSLEDNMCFVAESSNYTQSLRVEATKALALLEIAKVFREQNHIKLRKGE